MTDKQVEELRRFLTAHITHWRANALSEGTSVNSAVIREIASGKVEAYQAALEKVEDLTRPKETL